MTMIDNKPSICIIAHNALGAMRGGRLGHVGGVERQTSLTARWFAARGYATSLLTWADGRPGERLMIDGVQVLTMCNERAGIPVARFIHPRLTSLFKALTAADSNIYYHNCAEYVTGLVAFWCKRNKRKFIYSAAHDADCDVRLPLLYKYYERFLFKYGLCHADKLIVQTKHQSNLLMEGLRLPSVVLPMPCPGPSEDEYVKPTLAPHPRILWVGRVHPQKRPEWLLDIAERLPGISFDVAAANVSDAPYCSRLLARAKSLANVNWMGGVPRERMPQLYQQALCLCCTSDYEGFPNTFLEAWSYGKPLVTSFDPDGLVASRNLGMFARDTGGFVHAIQALLAQPQRWTEMSDNCRHYYLDNHITDKAIARFEDLFLCVCNSASSQPEKLTL